MLPVPQTQPALVFKNMVFLDNMAFPDTRFWIPECSLYPRLSLHCFSTTVRFRSKFCVFSHQFAKHVKRSQTLSQICLTGQFYRGKRSEVPQSIIDNTATMPRL